jgi:ribose transport system substrate-binding protein
MTTLPSNCIPALLGDLGGNDTGNLDGALSRWVRSAAWREAPSLTRLARHRLRSRNAGRMQRRTRQEASMTDRRGDLRRLGRCVAGGLVLAVVAGTATGVAADPWTKKLKDGSTFTLASRIQAEIKKGDKPNYVFSYASSGIAGFSQQYKAGYDATQAAASKILPMNYKAIAPSAPAGDLQTQIQQIQALVNTNQIDCLSIEPNNSTDMTSITNQLMAKGIPVFTVGLTSNGNEFTNFTQVPNVEGHTAAATVLAYMKAHNLHFKTFAVSGGDPSQYWAVQRALGFRQGIQKAIPGATFLTTEKSMLNVSYDPAKTYDAYKAFLSGKGKNVDVIENVDIGAGYAARAIKDAGRLGKSFSVGWNVTPEQIAALQNNTEIALFDQKWPEQAGFGALACANFLKTGKVLPNSQRLSVITKQNYAQAEAALKKLTTSG